MYQGNKCRKIDFRVSEEEYEILEKNARNHKNISEYMRAILNEQMPAKKNKKILLELEKMNYLLLKIGTNINQITKNNNSKFYSLEDKKILQSNMEILQKEFRKVEKTVRKL